MEGAHAIKTGTLLKLSEQQLVDCDKTSSGCNGGLESYAFDYAIKNPITTEAAYPYTAKNGVCKPSSGVVSVTSYTAVAP